MTMTSYSGLKVLPQFVNFILSFMFRVYWVLFHYRRSALWDTVALRLERPALNRENPGSNPRVAVSKF